MVLNAAQTTAFVESPDQMGIPWCKCNKKEFNRLLILQIFEKQSVQLLADNLRKPGGRVPDPDPNTALEATIPMPAFTYGAKSQKRLTVACDLVRLTENAQMDTFKAPCCCFENVPNTALTVV